MHDSKGEKSTATPGKSSKHFSSSTLSADSSGGAGEGENIRPSLFFGLPLRSQLIGPGFSSKRIDSQFFSLAGPNFVEPDSIRSSPDQSTSNVHNLGQPKSQLTSPTTAKSEKKFEST